jgi:hypothetical protein
VIEVDADRQPSLARLAVHRIPSLLLGEGSPRGRPPGRCATGRQIDDLIRPHLV